MVADPFSRLAHTLLQDEAASGKFLLGAVIVAVFFVNSPWRGGYEQFWLQHFSFGLGSMSLSDTLVHWIDEGLMAIFFLAVGLEIKREQVRGELRTMRAASLPIVATIGGMIVPALIFMAINTGHAGFHGWGIPMTTDIAFAIGA